MRAVVVKEEDVEIDVPGEKCGSSRGCPTFPELQLVSMMDLLLLNIIKDVLIACITRG